MSATRIFPFDLVSKGSRVILYGAGKHGRDCWEQNRISGWCEIIMVADGNYEHITEFPQKVDAPAKIAETVAYDYVVVAIAAENSRAEVVDKLLSLGVAKDKIIAAPEGYFYREDSENISVGTDDGGTTLSVGFHINKALGDQVIFLGLYRELKRLAPMLGATIFCLPNKTVKSVLFRQEGIEKIVFHEPAQEEAGVFDLFVEGDAFAWNLKTYCPGKIRRLCPALYTLTDGMYHAQITMPSSTAPPIYSNRLIMERARLLGLNRYNYIFGEHIAAKIYIDAIYEKRFHELIPHRPYMTFHYGASAIGDSEKRQVKVWPREYQERLNRKIKEQFPDLLLVQIGGEKERVEGADCYVLGESLEITKYALKNALCHFDCESGLVHLATGLGTKCFVVFGPTPVWFFGYEQNENIAPQVCGECAYLTKDWYVRCIKYDRPECMYSITPESVFERLRVYLEENISAGRLEIR